MDILMVSAEFEPWASSYPAGAMVAACCKALRQQGHEVTLALPHYPAFEEGGLLLARRLTPLSCPGVDGADDLEVTILDGQLSSGVKLALFDGPGLFDRDGVFGEDGDVYSDNAERFGLFCRGVAALVRQRAQQGQSFEVVHCFDWPTAAVPALLNGQGDRAAACVLTLTDARRGGAVQPGELGAFGLPKALLEAGGRGAGSSLLEVGIRFADRVTTVSPTYAEALRGDETPDLGEAFAALGERLVGIVPGVDYSFSNPATDPTLARRYDAEDPSGKATCRMAIARELDLDLDLERPIVAIFGPFTKERGFEQVLEVLPALFKNDACVILASGKPGDAQIVDRALDAIEDYEGGAVVLEKATAGELSRILSAADLLLVPPHHEPGITEQLRAQRYGAVPVVQGAGALADSVVDCDAQLETGTGFVFDEADASSMKAALGRAVAAYRHPSWSRLRQRVMRLDVSWDRPARRLQQVYRQAILAGR